MRIALLSDIHGNSVALDAVLADIDQQGGVDAHWVLGDMVAIGHDPLGVMERLAQLPNVRYVRGNSENYVLHGVADDAPDPRPTNEAEWEHQIAISRVFAWTYGVICAGGWYDFFTNLPIEIRETLPDGTRLLGVHASPGKAEGAGFRPDYSDAEMMERIAGANADLVCVGHTHWAMNRMFGAIHLVNLGCISNPQGRDRRARYVILEANEDGYTTEHRYVEYDYEQWAQACRESLYPGIDFVMQFVRGEFRPKWFAKYHNRPLPSIPQMGFKYTTR